MSTLTAEITEAELAEVDAPSLIKEEAQEKVRQYRTAPQGLQGNAKADRVQGVQIDVVPEEKALTRSKTADWYDKSFVSDVMQVYAKPIGLTKQEFLIFLSVGRATGLNPFLKEIWAVKYGGQLQIFIGRDGYRKSAQSTQEYEYHWTETVNENDEFEIVDGQIKHKFDMKDRGALIGAYCVVKRRSAGKEMYQRVSLKEYSSGKSLWSSKPETMIKKVAEAQALRMAFQELFAGTYAEEENWNK